MAMVQLLQDMDTIVYTTLLQAAQIIMLRFIFNGKEEVVQLPMNLVIMMGLSRATAVVGFIITVVTCALFV